MRRRRVHQRGARAEDVACGDPGASRTRRRRVDGDSPGGGSAADGGDTLRGIAAQVHEVRRGPQRLMSTMLAGVGSALDVAAYLARTGYSGGTAPTLENLRA